MPLRTHYDNLKVARDAPAEVIRAAYRVLAQRYHPDVNSSADAARIMSIINEAYSVLSDPRRRAAHDAWIEEQLVKEAIEEAAAGVPGRTGAPSSPSPNAEERPAGPVEEASSTANVLARFTAWASTRTGVGPIDLQQIEQDGGTRYSAVTLTLYRVKGGNARFESLAEENF